MFCPGDSIPLVADVVFRFSVGEVLFLWTWMLSSDVLSGRFYSSGSGCCPPMLCQGGFIPPVVDAVLQCSVRELLEFR